jgi:hypothetical protein
MELTEIRKTAQTYLRENPSREKVYIVSDGQVFWELQQANNYANSLKLEVYEFPEIDNITPEPTPEPTPKKPVSKTRKKN